MNFGKIVADGTGGRVEKSKVLQEVLADLKTIQRFSTGFQGRTVDLGKPKDILLHTLSALGNHPGLDGSVSIFSSPKFFRKTKKIFSPLSPYSATKGPSTMGRRWVAGA